MLLSEFFETLYRPLRLRGRSHNTLRLYRYTIRCFEQSLGRKATLADLTDEQVSRHLTLLTERGLSPYSVNKERSQLLAIWNFAARKRYVEQFPDVMPERLPERIPLAWLEPEMQALIEACRCAKGTIAGIPAAKWWIALHYVEWDTAERIGAILSLRYTHLLSDGWLAIPAEVRKGKRRAKMFRLSAETINALEQIRTEREAIFPWPYHNTTLYYRYKKLLLAAGLPTDSRSKFHRLRRTVASHFKSAGGDPTELLDHTDPKTTKAYIDKRITKPAMPSEVIFRLG